MKLSLFLCATVIFFNTLSYSQTKVATPGAAPTGPRPAGGVRGFTSPAIGDTAPDFLESDVNGKPVHLSDFKGKWVLLDFWGPFCAPCRRQNPLLGQLYEKYKDKNFTILSVSINYGPVTKQQWLDAIRQDKMVWPNITDVKNLDTKQIKKDNVAGTKYGVSGLPRNFLIDPSGKIVALDLKGELLEQKLRELL